MVTGAKLRTIRRWGLCFASLALGVAFVHFASVSYDDAFISFRYAENLAAGRGLVFNPGDRVEGYSNFLWTILLALPALLGASKLQVGMLVAAKLLGAACCLATLWLTAKDRELDSTAPPAAAWPVAATYLALMAPFALWGGAGLETSLVGLLMLAVVVLDERERADGFRGVAWSFGAVCLAALTRPEPVLLAVPLLALRWLELERSRRAKVCARAALVFGLPYLTFLGFRLGYYGQLVPNTYFAKRAGDPEAWGRGWDYLQRAMEQLALWGVLATALIVLFVARSWSRSTNLVLAMLLTHAASVVYEGGDWMAAHRLMVPALPLLALLVERAWRSSFALDWQRLRLASVPGWVMPPHWAEVWNAWIGRAGERAARRGGKALRAGALGGLVAAAAASCLMSYRPWLGVPGSGLRGIELTRGDHFTIAFWLRDNLPEPGLLATGEAGVVPYYTKLPLLDLLGLMDPHLARLSGVRHRKFDSDYVLGRRPSYVLLTINRWPDGTINGAHTYSQALLHHPRFEREYAVMREFPRAILYRRVAP